MTTREPFNLDLPHHAADKVKRALDDVLQLTDDPGEKFRIALLAASVPIGAAGGFLAGKYARAGKPISQTDSTVQILELLRINATEGADAVFRAAARGGGEEMRREGSAQPQAPQARSAGPDRWGNPRSPATGTNT